MVITVKASWYLKNLAAMLHQLCCVSVLLELKVVVSALE